MTQVGHVAYHLMHLGEETNSEYLRALSLFHQNLDAKKSISPHMRSEDPQETLLGLKWIPMGHQEWANARKSRDNSDAPCTFGKKVIWIFSNCRHVDVTLFYSIQLSLRNFWYDSTHDSQRLYKTLVKSTHDPKWISKSLFKSNHD